MFDSSSRVVRLSRRRITRFQSASGRARWRAARLERCLTAIGLEFGMPAGTSPAGCPGPRRGHRSGSRGMRTGDRRSRRRWFARRRSHRPWLDRSDFGRTGDRSASTPSILPVFPVRLVGRRWGENRLHEGGRNPLGAGHRPTTGGGENRGESAHDESRLLRGDHGGPLLAGASRPDARIGRAGHPVNEKVRPRRDRWQYEIAREFDSRSIRYLCVSKTAPNDEEPP